MFELIIMKAKVSRDRYIRQFIASEKKLLKEKAVNISSTFFSKNKAVCSVRNHCIFSGKTRSTKHFFKISRNFLRDFGLFGKITGFEKKSWLFCSCGGIGRHGRFKIYCFNKLAGSNPVKSNEK